MDESADGCKVEGCRGKLVEADGAAWHTRVPSCVRPD